LKTDVLVLGGGIMGLATAYNVSRAEDSEIVVLDRFGTGNELCSSNDVNRVFRYSYGNDQLYTRMAVESLQLWRELEHESKQELLVQAGLLLLKGDDKNANAFNEASYKTLSKMGLGAERLGQNDLNKRFPQFRAEEAFFDPHGAVILASKALTTLRSLAVARGVKFLKGQAQKIVSGGLPMVVTDSLESVEFQRLIVTIGPWTNSLLLPGMTPMIPTRQQVVYLKPRTGLDSYRPATCPVFFTDNHYGLPAAGIDAVKISRKDSPEMVDPETVNRTVGDEQIVDCRQAAAKFVPGIADGEVVHSKVCLYDMTENSDFVLGQDPEHASVVFGYGFSGHGFKFAPLIGRLLAQLTLESKPSFDLERFTIDPDRRRKPTLGAHLGKGE
jgi:N-methyl-L-tryptophan oxidase